MAKAALPRGNAPYFRHQGLRPEVHSSRSRRTLMAAKHLRLSGRLRRTTVMGVAIFVFTLLVFLISHVHQVTDSSYSMMLSRSLLELEVLHSTTTPFRPSINWKRSTGTLTTSFRPALPFFQLHLFGFSIALAFPPLTEMALTIPAAK